MLKPIPSVFLSWRSLTATPTLTGELPRGTDDALRAITLYCDLVAGAVLDGLKAEMIREGVDIGEEAAPVEEAVAEAALLKKPRLKKPRQKKQQQRKQQLRLKKQLPKMLQAKNSPRHNVRALPFLMLTQSCKERTMTITAALVKDLRTATGAGMMDCKKALSEIDGDLDAAIDWLRKKGLRLLQESQPRCQ